MEKDLGMREEKRLCRNVGREREEEVSNVQAFKARRAKIKATIQPGSCNCKVLGAGPKPMGERATDYSIQKSVGLYTQLGYTTSRRMTPMTIQLGLTSLSVVDMIRV